MNTQSGNSFKPNASNRNSVREETAAEQGRAGFFAWLFGFLQGMIQTRDRIRSEVQTMQVVAAIPATRNNPFDLEHILSMRAKGKYEALLNEERLVSAEIDTCTAECTLAGSTGFEMAR